MKIFEVTHMQRSGGHACIKWLINNYFSEPIDLESVDARFLTSETKLMKIKGKDDKQCLFLNQYIPNGPDKDAQCISYVNKIQPEIFVISYENMPLEYSAFHNMIPTQRITIVRRFRNWYASYAKIKNSSPAGFERLVNLWLEHATNCNFKENCIYFDDWVQSQKYRETVSERLGLPLLYDRTERNSGKFGNGSSFDGVEQQIKEHEILNRYKQFNFSEQQKQIIETVKSNNKELSHLI